MWNGYARHGWGGAWGGWLLPLVHWGMVIAVVILAVALVAALLSGRGARNDEALGILEERYARGEIDAEEFERRRRRLGG